MICSLPRLAQDCSIYSAISLVGTRKKLFRLLLFAFLSCVLLPEEVILVLTMSSELPNGTSNDVAEGFSSQDIHNKWLDHVTRDMPLHEQGRTPSPQPTHLNVPGSSSGTPGSPSQRVLPEETGYGYVTPAFEGKAQQKEDVMDIVEGNGFIPIDFVESETTWFYEKLGFDDMYFATEPVQAVAQNIQSLYAAKIAAFARNESSPEIQLDKEASDHATYILTSTPGQSILEGPHYEQRIDAKYLNSSATQKAYRVESFRSESKLPGENSEKSLRCYFVYQCDFVEPNPPPGENRLEVVGDKRFLQKATPNTRAIYQEFVNLAVDRSGPVIEQFTIEKSRIKRLVIAYKRGSAPNFYNSLSDLYHYYGLTSSRKYVEQFSNGVTVISLYLKHPEAAKWQGKYPPIESSIYQIVKETSLLYCIPKNKFQDHFALGRLSLQETIYAHCCWIFVSHFLNRLGSEYTTLSHILDPENSSHAELLSKIKRRLRNETFTPEYLIDIISKYPDLIKALYLAFANDHYVQTRGEGDDFLPTLSYLRTKIDRVLKVPELEHLIKRSVANEHDELVMSAFTHFNQSLLKTNFYTPTKVALSFRLDPSFLPKEEYPQPLFGMFLVISSESRGFHLRFKDVARGGIRIVKSRSSDAYAINARSLFDEGYNLASTQQRKNKDIPEGGSKGTILLDVEQQDRTPDKARVAFEKYIDSILDLLLPPHSPGIKDQLKDYYGKEEILFMGPDENTADLVNWATEHARKRGAPWWKSFFTGKSPKLGGIPHDTYGMTSLSVREYVLGIYRKLNLDPSKIRKVQIGGPDGDLGSNEILLSNEKYTAVVDGSGVLVDPEGIDSGELLRLAKARQMISKFDTAKLSPSGSQVLVESSDVKLANGEEVSNGTLFRNTFHLRADDICDMFVPCGGRPESVDISSVNHLIQAGQSKIPYIVEGANLFLTQDARLKLEKAGAIVFKDASANKGGVTSSSLEVLASLSFNSEEYIENMCVGADGTTPKFYIDYVEQVQQLIKNNAALEFEAIWKEHERTGVPRCVLSDKLSNAITNLDEELQETELWYDLKLRKSVLYDALPDLLLEKVGFHTIMERVPENYLRAIFGSYLASRFVYENGSSPSQFAFFGFMRRRMAQIDSQG